MVRANPPLLTPPCGVPQGPLPRGTPLRSALLQFFLLSNSQKIHFVEEEKNPASRVAVADSDT